MGTTATTVVVFAPLALIPGVVGAFFGALAVTLSIAVVLSLVFALTLVPLVATALLKARTSAKPPGGRLSAAYGRVLRRVVHHPVLSVGAVLLAGVSACSRRARPRPASCRRWTRARSSSTSSCRRARRSRRRTASRAASTACSRPCRSSPTSRGPPAPRWVRRPNRGDILVCLVPRDERPPVHEPMDTLRENLSAAVPEARIELVQVLQDVLGDLEGNPNPIEVKVFGPDPAVLGKIAPEIAAKIEDLGDLEDLFNGVQGDVPEFRADADVAAADR